MKTYSFISSIKEGIDTSMKFSSLFSSKFSGDESDDPAVLLAEPQSKPQITGSGVVVEDGVVVSDENDWRARFLFENTIRSLLRQRQFGLLERIAAEARRAKSRFPGGEWKLRRIYEGLTLETDSVEPEWRMHFDNLKQWVSADPYSITANIAIGKSQVVYAWKARTDSFAADVPEKAWESFFARLGSAKEALFSIPEEERECPEWYFVMMAVARGEGWEREDLDALYADACAFAPDYETLHVERAVQLLPRWFGDDGESHQAIDDSCRIIGGQEGAAAYFLAVKELLRYHTASREGFKEMQASQEMLLAGISATEQLYGLGSHDLNSAALFCRLCNDKENAALFLRRIGDDWDEQVWGREKYFKSARKWAGS
jgi:hypothetical protein